MKCALIVAMSQNRTIGIDNKLPWYLPGDLKYFKQVTMGKPIIMGRKTFDSIGKPLPGRPNIVVTRQSDYQAPEGVIVVNSVPAALDKAEDLCFINDQDEVMVIGGAEIYTQAMNHCARLYITHVHSQVEGDAHFPEVEWADWQEVAREDHAAEEPNPHDYSFVVYDRVC